MARSGAGGHRRLPARALGLVGSLVVVIVVGGLVLWPSGNGTDTGPGADIYHYLEVLPAVDAGDEGLSVVYGDLARAAELAGVSPPSDPTDFDSADEYLRVLWGLSPDRGPDLAMELPRIVNSENYIRHVDDPELVSFVEEVGWDVVQVDQFGELLAPDSADNVAVLDGSFDRARIREALPEVADDLYVVGDPGAEPGRRNRDEMTIARPLGQTLWFAWARTPLDRARLVGGESRPQVTATADPDGDRPTLADDDVLVGLAEALDDHDAYAAQLDLPPRGWNANPYPEDSELYADGCEGVHSLADVPAGVAVGVTDDDGPVVLVALAYGDEPTARANADALEQIVNMGNRGRHPRPYREEYELDGIGIDGTVATARLRTVHESPWGWQELLWTANPLVAPCLP